MIEAGRYAEAMASRSKKKKQRVHIVFKVGFGTFASPGIVSVYHDMMKLKSSARKRTIRHKT